MSTGKWSGPLPVRHVGPNMGADRAGQYQPLVLPAHALGGAAVAFRAAARAGRGGWRFLQFDGYRFVRVTSDDMFPTFRLRRLRQNRHRLAERLRLWSELESIARLDQQIDGIALRATLSIAGQHVGGAGTHTVSECHLCSAARPGC